MHITKCNSISGESTVIFTRGKKKYGYDLHAKFTYNIIINNQNDQKDNTGELNIVELADFNEIDDTEIKFRFDTESDMNNSIKKLLHNKLDKLHSQLEKWVSELKKQ